MTETILVTMYGLGLLTGIALGYSLFEYRHQRKINAMWSQIRTTLDERKITIQPAVMVADDEEPNPYYWN